VGGQGGGGGVRGCWKKVLGPIVSVERGARRLDDRRTIYKKRRENLGGALAAAPPKKERPERRKEQAIRKKLVEVSGCRWDRALDLRSGKDTLEEQVSRRKLEKKY